MVLGRHLQTGTAMLADLKHKDFDPRDYAGAWYLLARLVVWYKGRRLPVSRFRWVGGENGHEV